VIVLSVSLALLLWTERQIAARSNGARELAVRIFSRGECAADAPSAEQGLHGEISIGTTDLVGPAAAAGVRVAVVSPARELTGFRNFDLAHSPEDVRALADLCRAAVPETVLALCVRGAVEVRDEDRALVTELFSELDAEAPPLESPGPSWALVSVRGPSGWVRLAESRSDNGPTRLSFLLRPPGFDWERRPSRLRVDE
jgi:hypothetical protein